MDLLLVMLKLLMVRMLLVLWSVRERWRLQQRRPCIVRRRHAICHRLTLRGKPIQGWRSRVPWHIWRALRRRLVSHRVVTLEPRVPEWVEVMIVVVMVRHRGWWETWIVLMSRRLRVPVGLVPK